MQAKKLTLAAGAETAFEFDSFFGKSIIVKNMTSGAIQFCDGPFNAAKAATIPPYGWQSFGVNIPYGETPNFYVKAVTAGEVEIDFGSEGMGFTSNTFDLAGMIPHTLTLTVGENTTLTAKLTRLHGETLDLDTPVAITSGATVYVGDVVEFTAATTEGAGYHVTLTVGEALELDESGKASVIVTADIVAVSASVADEEV